MINTWSKFTWFATGSQIIQAISLQIFWITLLVLTGQLLLRLGVRRLEIQGVEVAPLSGSLQQADLRAHSRPIAISLLFYSRGSYYCLSTLVSFLTLAMVLQTFNNVGGWTIGQVAFLFGMVETAFGVTDMVFSGFDPSSFGQQVRLVISTSCSCARFQLHSKYWLRFYPVRIVGSYKVLLSRASVVS